MTCVGTEIFYLNDYILLIVLCIIYACKQPVSVTRNSWINSFLDTGEYEIPKQ